MVNNYNLKENNSNTKDISAKDLAIETNRRGALQKIGRYSTYAAPILLASMNNKAHAGS